MPAGPADSAAPRLRLLSCVRPIRVATAGESPMNRYVAPLGFTLAAVWVMVVFVLVSTIS
ncbi:MAG TPA: hypothetical protein VHN18_08335 [Micromonosporaceae bacterium]|nr:hypothetical protein [Micromonosporaceae bacterium]